MTTDASPAPEVEAVRRKAAGSSFYSAMRLMPKAEREAMYAIYAFCRAVDDIADNGIGTRQERHLALNAWRGDLARLVAGGARNSHNILCAIACCVCSCIDATGLHTP